MRPGSGGLRGLVVVLQFLAVLAVVLLLRPSGAAAVGGGEAGAAPAVGRPAGGTLPGPLAGAIRDGDLARVHSLLAGGTDVNARDAEGRTPLLLAALYAGGDCIELLLKKGADPNAADAAGASALVYAATDAAKVRLLVAAGAKVGARTALGNTPLILAARKHGNAAAVELLLRRGADARERNDAGISPIMAAAAGGDLDSVRALLDKGADPNDYPGPSNVHPLMPGGRTPLMWAAYRDDVPMTRLLLERGADPNKPGLMGTPLIQAAWHDSADAARLLLERGARVDARDGLADFTALHWVASTDSSRTDLAKMLLAHGADPNAAGGDPVDAFLGVPQTPLMLAARRGDTPIVHALVAAGARAVPAPSDDGPPPRAVPEKIDQAVLRDAAERALAPLQRSAAESPAAFLRQANKQQCVSCHQQYLPMAAVGHARLRSLRLDDKAAREQVDLLERVTRTGNAFDRLQNVVETLFHPDAVFTRGYELFGLAAHKVPAGAMTDAMVHHLATIQAGDGRWLVNLPRPPIQSSDVSATALAIQAIRAYGWVGRKAEFDAAVDRGRHWLRAVQADTNEKAVFQILGLRWAGEPADNLAGLAKALVARQREDGGWSQLPTLRSDAYATGQALYALSHAAGVPVTDAAWRRGLRYLLATQRDDGTWYAKRRAFPFQPTMSSGFPHGRDAWLSAAATSWAVMALTEAIDPSEPAPPAPAADGSRPVAEAAEATASPAARPAPGAGADFVRDVKPLLERSCVACHGPARARSHFRVDSRDALLKGGDSGEAAVVPGHSGRSRLVDHVVSEGDDLDMPPRNKRDRFPPLSPQEVQLLRAWIDQNAPWPQEATLQSKRD